METNEALPKKILRIKDLMFILPDTFSGDLSQALELFLKYREKNAKNRHTVDPDDILSAAEILMMTINESAKFCGQYGIFELVDTEYELIPESLVENNPNV